MARQQSGRKIYKTAQGKNIDLDLLISRNELTPAVGNARVNARGDELGPGGKIVRKREQVLKEYYNTKGVVEETVVRPKPITELEEEMFDEFDNEPVPEKPVETKKSKTQTLDEWIEDEDGNFIRKGE